MLNDVLSAIKIFKELSAPLKQLKRPPESIADRFLRLLTAHGVHPNQIPRFFGHGIKFTDVQSGEQLIQVLTDEVLQSAADLFGVNVSWLEGASEEIYPVLSFYKQPDSFERFIAELLKRGNDCSGRLLLGRSGKTSKYEHFDAVLVVEETIGYIDDREVNRIYLCDHWIFNYWKCRAFLTACVAIAWKHNVYIRGELVDRTWLASFAEGMGFLSDPMPKLKGDLGELRYPEYMALRPDVFLQDLAVRDGKSSELSGLEHWLKLDEQGWMDCGDNESYRADFELALQALQRIGSS